MSRVGFTESEFPVDSLRRIFRMRVSHPGICGKGTDVTALRIAGVFGKEIVWLKFFNSPLAYNGIATNKMELPLLNRTRL